MPNCENQGNGWRDLRCENPICEGGEEEEIVSVGKARNYKINWSKGRRRMSPLTVFPLLPPPAVLRAWEKNKWKRCSENGRETKKVVGLCFGFLIIEKTKTKNVCLLIYNHQSLNFSYIVSDYFLLLWEKSVKIIYKYISVSQLYIIFTIQKIFSMLFTI